MITSETRLSEIFTMPQLAPYAQYLLYSPEPPELPGNGRDEATLGSLAFIGWSPDSIAGGLNFLLKAVEAGKAEQYFVYKEEDCADDPQKKNVNVIRLMPETLDETRPYIVLCSGGAYNSVCTMVESLPTARHMVELGYQVFMMTYRVAEVGNVPLAIADLASALHFINDRKEIFGIDPAAYAVGGFSAGANLISTFGVGDLGWKRYDLPKPICLFPVYTLVDLDLEKMRNENSGLLPHMFGPDFEKVYPRYNVLKKIDGDYPPCYLVLGKDDSQVPPVNSEKLYALLKEQGTAVVLDEGEHAPHGFGDGLGTDVEGWPKRAISFMESLM